MTIIQEMRLDAKALRDMPAFGDLYAHIASDMDRWADWLEKSGALVPVPDGNPVEYGQWWVNSERADVIRIGSGEYCIEVSGDCVAQLSGGGEYIDVSDLDSVQPVKFLPITEATP